MKVKRLKKTITKNKYLLVIPLILAIILVGSRYSLQSGFALSESTMFSLPDYVYEAHIGDNVELRWILNGDQTLQDKFIDYDINIVINEVDAGSIFDNPPKLMSEVASTNEIVYIYDTSSNIPGDNIFITIYFHTLDGEIYWHQVVINMIEEEQLPNETTTTTTTTMTTTTTTTGSSGMPGLSTGMIMMYILMIFGGILLISTIFVNSWRRK